MDKNRNTITDQNIAAFDLETTGVNALTDRIVTAAFIILYPDNTHYTREWLINPGVEIPEGAAKVHGITTEHARANGQDPREALEEISQLLTKSAEYGMPIIGHNVSYDMSLLAAELERHGLPALPWFPVADTMVIDKHVDKYRKGTRNLTATSNHYGVTLENAHSADADALASGLIFREMAKKYPEKVDIPLAELHANQVQWRREQQESLEKYLRKSKNDPNLTVEKTWPVYLEEMKMNQAAN